MAVQEKSITILSWPEGPAMIEHHIKQDEPCPVAISFAETPANVIINTSPKQPFNVDMAMKVVAKETIPVCIKVCEPICAESNYVIGITIFDHHVGSITIKGVTRFFNCEKEG